MPDKALGQHWLKDRLMLEAITDSVEITKDDTVLEIGPGLGTLTSALLRRANRVVAVEYDLDLASKLAGQFPGKDLSVIQSDFLEYDVSTMPKGYIVVANVPYYITTKIIRHLIFARNSPEKIALLVQQEVAEKLAAVVGKMTQLLVMAQLDYDIQLGTRVPRMYFTPPPNVDSQVIIFKKHHVDKIAYSQRAAFSRLLRAGFSSPRKKLRSNLSSGLGLTKERVEKVFASAGLDANQRAQDLSLQNWCDLLQSTYDKN